jgi:error-prone DNA polymerase
LVLSAGMMAVRPRIQREGAVVHLVAHHFTDLSDELASVGERDDGFPPPHGRGDQVWDGGSFSPDQRDLPPRGFADAGYLHPRPAHRHHQGKDASF